MGLKRTLFQTNSPFAIAPIDSSLLLSSMKSADNVILRAQFDPRVKTYYVASTCMIFAFSIVGIALLPIWIPLSFVFAKKWYNSLDCVLTDKTLRFKKGVFVRTEKTVPLDKITDLGSMQGPVMRALGIETMTIETAGSATPGALMSLAGVIDPESFRDTVLAQKEKLVANSTGNSGIVSSPSTAEGSDEVLAVLREIRDSLKNLENRPRS